jgi:hypothetical protein
VAASEQSRSGSVAKILHVALGFVALGHGASAGPQETAPTVTYFEEAKITVNARARADGFMRVRILPESGATAPEATILIPRRMNENDLARAIAEGLNASIGPDYEADRDAGEHVKLRKTQRDLPNFSVEITFNAPGFAVILDN